MSRSLMLLEINAEYYQEAHEQGKTEEELLKELNDEIQDELAEYDLAQLLKRMLSSNNHRNTVTLAPKKDCEESPRFLLVCRDLS